MQNATKVITSDPLITKVIKKLMKYSYKQQILYFKFCV